MTETSANAQERVVVTTFVAVKPSAAFEIFTRDIDLWWRQSPRYRRMPGQTGKLSFEGTPPERLVERGGSTVTVLGRVLAWEAGKRLLVEWRGGALMDATHSEVEVRFEPLREGTRVTLEHKGIGMLPAGHPARHGLSGEAFEAMFGYFWADALVSYRLRCG
jgi:uncharacterized protein YndB with AHSA1/START domain